MISTCIDLTGQRFGRLTVIKKDIPSRTGHARWICRCDCGKEKSIASAKLRSGNTKSCGCLRSENLLNDLTGQRFGKLTVIKRDDPNNHKENKSRLAYWICKCDCGNTHIASSGCLTSGDTQSCGCLKSKGEEIIALILKEHNIDYQQQYSFPDLRGEKGGLLKFDFAIFENKKLLCLIEFQGEQHYFPHIYDSQEQFETRLRYDQLKKNYCNKKNINLLEISFKERNNLSWDYLFNLIWG